MFPTSGYFRAVNCPFFANGLCERPYCHFRHSKPPEEKSKDDGPRYSTSVKPYSPVSTNSFSSTTYLQSTSMGFSESYSTSDSALPTSHGIESYTTSKESGSSSSFVAGLNSHIIPSFSEKQVELPKSDVEEKIDQNALPKISGLAKRRPSTLPSYNPTPKNQTNDRGSCGDIPKYCPTPKTSTTQVASEYDPVKNFTFWPNISHGDKHCHDCSNGVQESTADRAIFSDDEAEQNDTVSERDDPADTRPGLEDISNRELKTQSSVSPQAYEELLTPSSYFTSQSSNLSEKHCKSSIDSDSSSKSKQNGDVSQHTSKSHHSKKSESHHNHRHHNLQSSSSKESRKHASSHSSEKKSLSSSRSHTKLSKYLDKGLQSSSQKQHSVSSHVKSSSSHSSTKHKHSNSSSHKRNLSPKSGNADSTENPSKKLKNSLSSHHSKSDKESTKPSSSSSSSSSKHSSSSSEASKHRKYHSDKSKNNHESVSKHSSSKNLKSCDKIRRDSGSHQSLKDEKLFEKKPDRDLLKERKLSLCSTSEVAVSHHRRRSSQPSDASEKSLASIKKERRDSREMLNGKHRHMSIDSSKSVSVSRKSRSSSDHSEATNRKRRDSTSKLTSRLFGEESNDSDSDCQIVERSPEPPPVVYELSDSDGGDKGFFGISQDEGEEMDFSDGDTFDECLKIFQESEKHLKSKSIKQEMDKTSELQLKKSKIWSRQDSNNIETTAAHLGKKRMAHDGAEQIARPVKKKSISRPRLSPAEVMHNRIVEIQKKALLRAARREGRESDLPKEIKSGMLKSNQLTSLSLSASSLISNQKKREAHSPMTPTKVSNPLKKTTTFSPNSFYTKKSMSQISKAATSADAHEAEKKTITIASTASKTEKRKAHMPTKLNLKRPVLPVEFNAKVATNIRQRYLNLIIDEFHKFCSEEESIAKGQEEEEAVYKRATNKNIYLHVAVGAIKKIRMQAAEAQPSSSKKFKDQYSLSSAAALPSRVSQSHEATLGGAGAMRTSFTLNRSRKMGIKQPTDFKGEELYKRLTQYILTETQLRENGFPRTAEDKSSKAVFYKEHEADNLLKDNERICRRCGKRYLVDSDGYPSMPEQCIYHYGRAYKKKVAGSFDSRYGCCNERAGVKGCQVAKVHVNERNKFINLTGYMKTLTASESDARNHKVLSLDCEMVYTKAGLELARVTVIGDDNNVIYESLVKPDSDIIDYNTRFSGITEKNMHGVTTTLRDIQAIMLSIASDKTILMGHSLESDLTALKIIHNTVVDTSIVFPHRLGLPYKRALKNLMVDHLQKIIQIGDGGHDSKEDAMACMQLMLHRVKENAKREYRCN